MNFMFEWQEQYLTALPHQFILPAQRAPYNRPYYYMALACDRYNARFDWLIVTEW